MSFAKVLWGLRALRYSLVSKIKMPSYIGNPMFISKISALRLGKRVRIYPGIRLETGSKNAKLIVGDNTSIGQNFHAVAYNKSLWIGSNVTISGNVFMTNCDHSYKHLDVHILEQPIIERETVIGDNCFIGYGAVIQAGTVLGKQCIVGANAVVRGVFPDNSVIAGIPAKIIKQYDKKEKKWKRVNGEEKSCGFSLYGNI